MSFFFFLNDNDLFFSHRTFHAKIDLFVDKKLPLSTYKEKIARVTIKNKKKKNVKNFARKIDFYSLK
jgi:hypothetical protein